MGMLLDFSMQMGIEEWEFKECFNRKSSLRSPMGPVGAGVCWRGAPNSELYAHHE